MEEFGYFVRRTFQNICIALRIKKKRDLFKVGDVILGRVWYHGNFIEDQRMEITKCYYCTYYGSDRMYCIVLDGPRRGTGLGKRNCKKKYKYANIEKMFYKGDHL